MNEADQNNKLEEINALRKALAEQQANEKRSTRSLQDTKEELMAQREELTAAVEELSVQNDKLRITLETLQQRNHEIDQIVYRASHDLRAPVTSLLGVNNLLQQYQNDSFIQDCCGHMQLQLLKMNSLLNSLSSLAQVTISEPQMNDIDLNFILNDVVKECQHLLHSDTMQVKMDLQGNFKFQSDPNFIRVIVYELITNAFIYRDYSRQGLIMIHVRAAEDRLTIKIADTGDGISNEIRNEIFSMFYRGSDKSLGNGLGLYKVLKCVKSLGGSITLETGQGTQFVVSIPVNYDIP